MRAIIKGTRVKSASGHIGGGMGEKKAENKETKMKAPAEKSRTRHKGQ